MVAVPPNRTKTMANTANSGLNTVSDQHRHVPGEDAAGEARNQRAQQPGDNALAHHIDTGHGGTDRILPDRLQRHSELRVAQINDEEIRSSENRKRSHISERGIEHSAQAYPIRTLGDVFEAQIDITCNTARAAARVAMAK